MNKFFAILILLICSIANSQTTNTYSYTGAVQTFTVPSCVTILTVEVRGAAGGASGMAAENGGAVYGVISVTPGQVLNIFVGGQGSITTGGYNGGGDGGGGLAAAFGAGGGGASDIRIGGTGLSNRVMVAGGGGGSGGSGTYSPIGGIGGGGGACLSPFGFGGQAGNGACSAGSNGSCAGGISPNYGSGGSGGGLNSGGSISGDGDGSNGSAGSIGIGGIGGSVLARNGGGGGGGGYYGGAGGMSGNFGCNGGGGGGSSFANDALFTNISFTAGAQTGHGIVSISHNLIPPPITQSVQICAGTSLTLTAAAAASYTWNTGANSQNIVVSPIVNTTYSVQSTSVLGCVTSTLHNVIVDANPKTPVNISSATVNIGNGSTPNSSFAPAILNFADPLPPGARVVGYTLDFDAVDQGWGGTGCTLGTGVSGTGFGGALLSHSIQHFNYSYYGPTTYSLGTTNHLSINFCGWGGWQAFIYNTILIIHYDMGEIEVCSGTTVTLTAGGATSYTWSGGISNGTSFIPSVTNIYSVSATHTNGCVSTNTVEVTVNPTPTLAVSGPTLVCEGNQAIQTVTGADTFTWSTSVNTNTIAVTPSGSFVYTVAGTNTLGVCSSSITGTVVSSPIPTIIANNFTICQGNPVTLSASGANTFTYSSGSPIVTPATTQTYSITGTSAAGCISNNTAIATVVVNPLPAVSIIGATTSCSGELISLTANNADSYLWNTSATSQIISPSPLISTNYSVTGTNTLTGCSNTAAVTATVNPRPTVSVTNGTICNGSTFTLIPSGAITYTFSSGSNTVSPSTTSNYSVTGTGTNGCTNSVVANVLVNPIPSISVNSGSICMGQLFTIIPGGAATYTVSGGLLSVSPPVNSTYTISGTSAAGCESTLSAISSVSVVSLPTVSVSDYTICSGNSVVLSPSGAVNYTYSGGTATVSPVNTSSYSISGSNAQGCISASAAVSMVNVNITPTVSVNSGSICQGQTFTIVPSGAVTYTIAGGSFQVSPATNTAYIVNGTSAEGCVGTILAISSVTVNPLPVISVNSGTICEGVNFTMVPSGAATYTFSSGSAIVSPPSTNTYTVNGTSAAGCLNTLPAISTVSVFSRPIIALNSGSICSGQSFTISPTGANTYTFLNGGPIVTPNTTTQFSVSGTSTAGCATTVNAVSNVTVFATPVIAVNSGSMCANSVFTMIPSGANTYTFSGGNSATVSPLATTNFSVSGTSTAGCTSTVFAISNVTVHNLPIISVNSGSICEGVTFTMIPSGAVSYTFSNGTNTVSPAISTNYSVSGSSSVGCLSNAPAISNVSVFVRPIVALNSGSICSGESFTISPTGAFTYTYLNGGPVVTPLATTQFSVSGTSTAGCVSASVAVSDVTVFATPIISVNSGSICATSVFTMVPSGANTYTFSGGNSATVSPLANTNYSVSGTSTAGCTSTVFAISNVTVHNLPIISVNSGSICVGETFTMVPTGAVSYTFSNGAATVTPVSSTDYSVTGMSSLGCISGAPAVSSVTVNLIPVISVNSGSICSGESFTLVPTGANTYTYLNGGPIVTPVATSDYSVVGTSSAGCVSAISAVSGVTVFATPIISVNSGSICATSIFTLVPSGANTYTFSSGNSATVSPLANTIYSVSGTSTAGCTSTLSAISSVTVINLPVISATSGTICQGETYTIIPSGASTYTFSNGNATVNPMLTTSYSVTGTNSVGCISSNTAVSTVTVHETPTITVSSGSICSGQTFTMSPSGALTYTVTGGSFIVSPVVTSNYSVSGTSSAGCNSSVFAVSNVAVETTPTISVNSGTICFGDSFTISPSGANTYSIQGGSAIVSPTANNTYTIIGYSIGACPSLTDISTITVNSLPLVTASLSLGEVCTGNSVTANAFGANTYTWSNGIVNNVSFSPTISATYSVLGQDLNGCINNASVSILVNNLPVISIISTHSVSCEAETVTLTVTGAQNYLWSDATTGLFIAPSPTATTNYSVVGTDTNGCSSSAQIAQSVTVCAETISAFALPENVTCQRKKDGKIAINSTVAYKNYAVKYLWNPESLCPTGDCSEIDSLDAGTYGVTVKITYTLNNILVKQDSVVLGPITLTDVGSECILNVYQGVSANNDGVNDHLYIENIEQFPNNRVTLYNRWGALVATIEGYDNIEATWPKSEEVQKLQSSTYFYIIDLGDNSGVIKGWIELVKD